MAERRRELHPDQVFTTRQGREIQIVSEQQIVDALARMGEWVNFAGGVVELVVFRSPTDLPGEMVTVGAVVGWKDRTDAKPQPEPASPIPQSILAQTGSQQRDAPEGRGPYATQAEIDAALEGEKLGELVTGAAEDGTLHTMEGEPYLEPGPPASAPPGEPAPPATDEDLDDGLGEDPDAVDESAIPEHAR